MSETKYDNPLVAGFGTATADEPPLPAQQHLDAVDGEKVAPVVRVQENTGAIHDLDAGGEESDKEPLGGGPLHTGEGSGDGAASPEDLVAEGDYEAKGVTKEHLEDEIDARNEGRDEADKISKSGNKSDLIARLREDDEQ